MTSRPHVLLIGAGAIANQVHLPFLARSRRIGHLSVSDVDEAAAQAAARRYSARVHRGPLEESKASQVWLCTPADTHAELATRALRAGMEVVVEKPLALSVADATAVARTARRHGRRLWVCHTPRHRPDVELLVETARSGRLGRLRRLSLRWCRQRGVPGTTGARSVGVVWDLGSHLVNVASAMVDDLVGTTHATAHTLVTDDRHNASWYGEPAGSGMPSAVMPAFYAGFTGSIVTADGLSVDVSAAWSAPTDLDLVEIDVTGSRATATLRTVFGFSPARRVVSGPPLVVTDLRTGHRETLLAEQLVAPDEYHVQLERALDPRIDPEPGLTQAVTTVAVCELLATHASATGAPPEREVNPA